MLKDEIIQDLIKKINELPYRDIEKLDAILIEVAAALKNFSGQTSGYRADLKMIRFSPWSSHASEAEYKRSWESGKSEIFNIFKKVLEDPTILALPAELKNFSPIKPKAVKKIEETEPTPPKEKEEPVPVLQETYPNVVTQPIEIPNEKIPNNLVSKTQKEQKENGLRKLFMGLKSIFKPKIVSPAVQAVESISTQENKYLQKVETPSAQSEITVASLETVKPQTATVPEPISTPISESISPTTEKKQEEKETLSENKENKTETPIAENEFEVTVQLEPQSVPEAEKAATTPPKNFSSSIAPQRVLIIHSSDDNTIKNKVTEKLKKMGLEPVFSRDKTNVPKPMIQKFSEFSNVRFVLVILSAEEFSYGKDQKPKDAKMKAPQNVIFELGYALGKFGRNNVQVLYQEKKNFELPSQFFDAFYTPVDKAGYWEKDLAERLRNSGYNLND